MKTLEGELTDKERIKFLQEAAIMAQFKHNFVVCLRGLLIDHPVSSIVKPPMKDTPKEDKPGQTKILIQKEENKDQNAGSQACPSFH